MMATSVTTTVTSLSDVFKRLEENINIVIQQIKNGERNFEGKKSFNRENYWGSVDALFKMLSGETTKISLAFSKKPFPSVKNTEAMVINLEQQILTLVSLFYSLPRSEGSTLLAQYEKAVLQVLDCLQGFTASCSRLVLSERHDERLQWTGGVWEASSFVFPRDNRECVKRCLADTAELVQDALGEINEAKETEGSMEGFNLEDDRLQHDAESWSDQDKEVINACEGLVKTTKAVLKKSRECVDKLGSEAAVSTLDDLANLTSPISSRVDDFICCIYVPVNYCALNQNGKSLAELIEKCLEFLRESDLTTNDNDTKWLDFLSQAVGHNLLKLKDKTKPEHDQG